MELNLKNSNSFLKEFLSEYLSHGFQSLSKTDLDLLIFYLLNKNRVLDIDKSIHATSKLLKISPSRVKNLMLNSTLRWDKIDSSSILESIFNRILTAEKLDIVKKQNPNYIKANKLPILLENPVEKLEFENAVKMLDSIPEYVLNREVLIINISTIIQLARKAYENENFDYDNLIDDKDFIKSILKKDLKKINFDDFKLLLSSLKKNIENNSIETINKFSIFSLLGILK